MKSDNRKQTVRVAMVTRLMDRPMSVATLAAALSEYEYFELTVFCCAERASWEALPIGPAFGTGPGHIAVGDELERKRDRTKQQGHDIDQAMEEISPGKKLQINYVQGGYHRVADALSSDHDLLVVPHRFQFPSIFGRLFRDLDTDLAFAGAAPILFCASPPI